MIICRLRIYNIVVALIAFVTIVGCERHTHAWEQLDRAERLLNTNPDSAYILMSKMDVSSWSHGERMRYELMKTDAQNKADILLTSDSIMKEVVEYFDNYGTNNERVRAYYLLGSVYRDMDSIPNALNAFNKATEIADTMDVDCDFLQLATIHAHKSNLFIDLYPSDYAIEENRKAAYYYLKGGDFFSYAVTNEWLSDIYSRLDSLKKSKKYGIEAYRTFQKISERDAALSAISLALIYIRFGESDKAIPLLEEFEREIDIKQAKNSQEELFDGYYLVKAYVLFYKGETTKALEYLRLAPKNNIYLNLDVDRCYVNLYEKTGQRDSVAKYQELSYNLQNEIYKESKANNLQQVQAMYNYAQVEQEAKEASGENSKLKGVLLLLTIIIFVSGFTMYHYLNNRKEKVRKLEDSYMASMVKLNVAQYELTVVKEQCGNMEMQSGRLKAELKALREQIDRDSVLLAEKESKEKVLQTRQAQLEQLLKDKESEIGAIKQILNGLSGAEITESIELSPELCHIANRLRLLASKGQRADNKDLAALADYAEKSNPEFFQELHSRYSNMSSQLVDICLLLRLNFSPYEIGVLLLMSPQAVSNARRRLMKKLFDEEGSVRRFDILIKRL